MTATNAADRADRAFLGHPKGLGYLAFTEAWERFSYYGMQTLLVLYMVHQLLLPGHIEHVAGFPQFQRLLEAINHRELAGQALASAVFGLYTALVYFTPFFGGLLADRLVGRTPTIVLGSSLMVLGHFLMAFDVSFIPALVCLMLGAGCVKGNIATQVGHLYSEADNRRADAFQIFYLGINAGVIAAPFVTGTLAEKVAWHYGFGAAGVGMAISLVIYLSGRKYLPPEPPRRGRGEAAASATPMSARDWRVTTLLLGMIPVLAAGVVGNQEIFNAYLVWAERKADLHLFGMPVLTEYLISVDSIFSAVTIAGMVIFWRVWKTRFREPDELGKMIIGSAFGAVGVAGLALGTILTPPGGKVSFGWLLLFHLFNDIGFANVLPVGLALDARASPRGIAGSIIGLYYLHLFAANFLVGWLGGFLEKMPAVQFWLIHAALVGGSGVVLLAVKLLFGRMLIGEPSEPDVEGMVVADAQETP